MPFKTNGFTKATPKSIRTSEKCFLNPDHHPKIQDTPLPNPKHLTCPTRKNCLSSNPKTLKFLTDVSPKHSLGRTQAQRIALKFMADCGLAGGFGHLAGGLEKGFDLGAGNDDLPQRF